MNLAFFAVQQLDLPMEVLLSYFIELFVEADGIFLSECCFDVFDGLSFPEVLAILAALYLKLLYDRVGLAGLLLRLFALYSICFQLFSFWLPCPLFSFVGFI